MQMPVEANMTSANPMRSFFTSFQWIGGMSEGGEGGGMSGDGSDGNGEGDDGGSGGEKGEGGANGGTEGVELDMIARGVPPAARRRTFRRRQQCVGRPFYRRAVAVHSVAREVLNHL